MLLVAVAWGVAEVLFRTLHTTRLSPVFLAAVLISGVNLGSGPAYLVGAIVGAMAGALLVWLTQDIPGMWRWKELSIGADA